MVRPAAPPAVPNYLVPAILVTLCCCVPFGIVAIVYAAQVNSKLAAGDLPGAVDASNKAKMWSWIAFGVGGAFALIYGAFMVLGALGGA
ncbi:MAG TPA: CD225/dispanin family protein [Thermoanaerobaculia bacterium]|nr:CD225/dispanin family protein [Thermoanaerobaculia bacterium]